VAGQRGMRRQRLREISRESLDWNLRWRMPCSPMLTEIPYGDTISYGEPAQSGRPGLPIIVPCHRVIGANGSLTGFGGGIERKCALLDLEARASRRQGDMVTRWVADRMTAEALRRSPITNPSIPSLLLLWVRSSRSALSLIWISRTKFG